MTEYSAHVDWKQTLLSNRKSNFIESNDTSFSRTKHQVNGRYLWRFPHRSAHRLITDIMIFKIKTGRVEYFLQKTISETVRSRNHSRHAKPLFNKNQIFFIIHNEMRVSWTLNEQEKKNYPTNNEKTQLVENRFFWEIIYFLIINILVLKKTPYFRAAWIWIILGNCKWKSSWLVSVKVCFFPLQ